MFNIATHINISWNGSFGCDLRDLCQGKSHMVRRSLQVLLVADIHRYHLIYDNYQMISYIYVYEYIVDIIHIYIYTYYE